MTKLITVNPKAAHDVNGFPQRLQNLALGSRCAAPHDEQVLPIVRFAPHEEQKPEPAMFAEPQVPHRPGKGGTYPPALLAM